MNTSPDAAPRQASSTPQRVLWILLLLLAGVLLLLITTAYWRSAAAGSQVQVPMFYDAHYLFPRPWTQDQAAPGVPDAAPLAFYGDNEISQTFLAGADQLAMISLWLAGPEGSRVTATLADSAGQVGTADIQLSSSTQGAKYDIAFAPLSDSKGRQFTLTLAVPEATYDSPVVARTVGGDRMGGSLRLNEYLRPGSLAISTYSRGLPGMWWFDALGEQLLPQIFRLRIQQYKPTAFKGKFFPALLVATAVLSGLLLVLASPVQYMAPHRFFGMLGWFFVIMLASLLVWQIGSSRSKIFPEARRLRPASPAHDEFTAISEEPSLMADLISDLWTAERAPEPRFIRTGLQRGIPAIWVPRDSQLNYSLTLPPDSFLRFARDAAGHGAIDFEILINDQPISEASIHVEDQSPASPVVWEELDLSPWAGQGVTLTLATSAVSGEGEGIWLQPQLLTHASWLRSEASLDFSYSPLDVEFDDSVELLGIVPLSQDLEEGGELVLQLLWRPIQTTDRFGKVFVHLIDGEDRLVAQHDVPPVNGAYPFPIWRPGTIVLDEHRLDLTGLDGIEPYRIEVGIYDPDTLQRWPASDAGGAAIEGRRAVIPLPIEVNP